MRGGGSFGRVGISVIGGSIGSSLWCRCVFCRVCGWFGGISVLSLQGGRMGRMVVVLDFFAVVIIVVERLRGSSVLSVRGLYQSSRSIRLVCCFWFIRVVCVVAVSLSHGFVELFV